MLNDDGVGGAFFRMVLKVLLFPVWLYIRILSKKRKRMQEAHKKEVRTNGVRTM